MGCFASPLPVVVEQGVQSTVSRSSSPGIVGGVTRGGINTRTSVSSSTTSTNLGGGGLVGGQVTQSRRTATSTTSGGVLGALKTAPTEDLKSDGAKSAAYIGGVVGTGVIGTPVVVATPVVTTGLVHRGYPHVGVGLGRVDVTRTETDIVSSRVY